MPFLPVYCFGEGSSEVASWSNAQTSGQGGGVLLPNGVLLGDSYSFSNLLLVLYLMPRRESFGVGLLGGVLWSQYVLVRWC